MASGTATGTEAPPAAAPERPTRAPGSGEAPAPGPGRLEHRLFLAGAVIVALHLVDDSFVQPQPGTSAGDHLVSGLVPLAAVGLAAATYGRLSGVSRAAVALVLGAFGVSLSVEAIHYTTHVGPSGDDFTGFLALPAGIGLLGLGVVTLWRTRNRGGGPVRLVLRRAGLSVVALLIAVYVVFPLVFSYTSTHVARPPVANIDLGANTVENVQLHTNDGLTLDGSYVPSRNGAAVIVAFGRKGTQAPARMLARHGYGVLIFDRRGEGRSDGDPNPFAWSDGERDILAAITFLK